MPMSCFVNGKICSPEEPCLRADDLGLQRAYAVFDYVRACNGNLFHLGDHLERLRRSASALELPLKYTDEEIAQIAEDLVARSGLKRPAVRFVLTGGYAGQDSSSREPNFIVTAEPLPDYPAEIREQGVKLVTYEYQRQLPEVKTTNYLNAFLLKPLLLKEKSFDALYFSGHRVTECPRSNFFMIRGQAIVTPKDNVLLGITRKVILELAKDRFAIEERPIEVAELKTADEAFVTSTSRGMVPVVLIDDLPIGDGTVGHRTRTIMKLLDEYEASY